MQPECTRDRLGFARLGRREVIADFAGGHVSSDAGGILLREADLQTGLLERFAGCFTDHRFQGQIEHSVLDLVRQRVIGIGLGYEDLDRVRRINEARLREWARARKAVV